MQLSLAHVAIVIFEKNGHAVRVKDEIMRVSIAPAFGVAGELLKDTTNSP